MNITKQDLQSILTYSSFNYIITFHHCELIRIHNILLKNNSKELAEKIKIIIFIDDYNNGNKTNFKTTPYKGNVKKILYNNFEYSKYLKEKRNIKNKMERYYEKE